MWHSYTYLLTYSLIVLSLCPNSFFLSLLDIPQIFPALSIAISNSVFFSWCCSFSVQALDTKAVLLNSGYIWNKTETKLKQNIVLRLFCFSFISDVTTVLEWELSATVMLADDFIAWPNLHDILRGFLPVSNANKVSFVCKLQNLGFLFLYIENGTDNRCQIYRAKQQTYGKSEH